MHDISCQTRRNAARTDRANLDRGRQSASRYFTRWCDGDLSDIEWHARVDGHRDAHDQIFRRGGIVSALLAGREPDRLSQRAERHAPGFRDEGGWHEPAGGIAA